MIEHLSFHEEADPLRSMSESGKPKRGKINLKTTNISNRHFTSRKEMFIYKTLTDFCTSPNHFEAFSFSFALGLSYKALMAW